jgi:hypothetical protein
MKKLVILFALFAAFGTTFANEITPKAEKVVEVKAVEGLKFKLSIPELNERGVVAIKTELGETVYKESITEAPAFVKVYNLTGFPDGVYYFEVKINGKAFTTDVKINTTVSRVASVK